MVVREASLEETEEGVMIGGRVISNLRYGDDTTLTAETSEGLSQAIDKIMVASASAGLYLNVEKTKVLTTAGITSFKVNSDDIEVVDHFDLLGSTIQEEV